MRTSSYLKFSIPELDDQTDIDVLGSALDSLDEAAGSALGKNGDGKDVSVTFSEASERANVASKDTLSTLFGKVSKFFTDLKTVAFTGSYSDLTGTPDSEFDLRILDFEGSTTSFLTDGSITEKFTDGRSIKTEFASDGSIVEKLYATNGVTVLKTKTTTFNNDGSISAVVA